MGTIFSFHAASASQGKNPVLRSSFSGVQPSGFQGLVLLIEYCSGEPMLLLSACQSLLVKEHCLHKNNE